VEGSSLRIAICQLDRSEVPPEVVISEAVVYSKRYASEDGARLVNGILGAIQRQQAVGR
jgi:N utilization substance protein B